MAGAFIFFRGRGGGRHLQIVTFSVPKNSKVMVPAAAPLDNFNGIEVIAGLVAGFAAIFE